MRDMSFFITDTDNGTRMSRPMAWLYDRTSSVDENGQDWGWPWHEDIAWVAGRTVALASALTVATTLLKGFSWSMVASAFGLSFVLVLVYFETQFSALGPMFLDVVFGGDRRVISAEDSDDADQS